MFLDQSPMAETPLLVGLFTFLITKGARQDERSLGIKMSSTYIALILAYAIKIITANLHTHQLLTVQLTEINHFLILVFSLAIVIYYCRMYINFNKASS